MAKVRAERQARILNAELHHRIKNTLAVVTSIVNRTLRPMPSANELRTVLLQRLTAACQYA